MGRIRKKEKQKKGFNIFDDEEAPESRRRREIYPKTRPADARSSVSTTTCSASASRS